MTEFDKLLRYLEDKRLKRHVKKTNRYNDQVIRINNNAKIKLQQMFDTTKISKRALASFGVFLLHSEFEKWLRGDMNSDFGYDVDEFLKGWTDVDENQVPERIP